MDKHTFDRTRIVRDLQALGLQAGDSVLVHSSLKSIGHVDGGPDTVIDALLEVLGKTGTLLMPSFQNGSEFYLCDRGCKFDVRNSPSELGIITETFRKRLGVIRSLNPTHCTAGLGTEAAKLLAGHENCKVSCGKGSPYHKICESGGKILLLGVTHGSNTTLHFVENTNGAPTVCRVLYDCTVIDQNGKRLNVPTYPHLPKIERNYPRVDSILTDQKIQNVGKIGMAESRLIDAGRMSEVIGAMIRQDPLFLIIPFNP
jgi:aminoglycoside 3-N-acetyltransferase